MEGVKLTVVAVLIQTVVSGSPFQIDCPSNTYSLHRLQSSKKTTITVSENHGVCEKIIKDDSVEQVHNDDLIPFMSVIQIGGEYYLNFTWRSSVIDGKYTRRFLLLLEYFSPGQQVQTNCIVLNLSRRKAEEHELYSKFSFHCLKLHEGLGRDEGYISIQVWNYCQRKFNAGCRRRSRSLGHKNSCKSVECSDKRHYSLSLESYKTEICSCYESKHGKPVVDNDVITGHGTVDFSLNITNLPDFMAVLTVEIFREEELVWSERIELVTDKFRFQNGSVQFVTSGILDKPGNYSATILKECYNNKMYRNPFLKCQQIVSYMLHLTEVKQFPAKHGPLSGERTKNRLLLTTVGVLAGVIVAGGITILAFLVYTKRKKQRGSSDEHSDRYHISLNNTASADPNPADEGRELLPSSEPYNRVILLHHPPDGNLTLTQVITQLGENDIHLVDGRTKNWRSFAESAILTMNHILVLVTDGLYELLCGDDNEKEARLIERQHENVPGIILQHLNVLPQRKYVCVHFVSTCDQGKVLLSELLRTYKFLKLTENYCVYNINSDSSVHLTDNTEFTRLERNLHLSYRERRVVESSS